MQALYDYVPRYKIGYLVTSRKDLALKAFIEDINTINTDEWLYYVSAWDSVTDCELDVSHISIYASNNRMLYINQTILEDALYKDHIRKYLKKGIQ